MVRKLDVPDHIHTRAINRGPIDVPEDSELAPHPFQEIVTETVLLLRSRRCTSVFNFHTSPFWPIQATALRLAFEPGEARLPLSELARPTIDDYLGMRNLRPCRNSSYGCCDVSGTVATPKASAEGAPQNVCGGTLRLTTVPALITAPSPIRTLGRMTQCGPIKTSFSIMTFPLLIGPLGPE